MPASTEEDEVVCDRESNQFELECKGESDDCRKRARVQKDLNEACALLWAYFQLTSRDRIEAQNGFEVTIKNNPIELLLKIK